MARGILGNLSGLSVKLVVPLLSVTGCATYDYRVDQPANVALHITPNQEADFKIDPLEYHLMDYDNRLIVQIVNPTNDAIEMLPTKSSVVDADGNWHPLRGQLITPTSYVRVIFPPTKSEPLPSTAPPTTPQGVTGNPTEQPGQLSGPTIGLGGEGFNSNQSSSDEGESQFDWNWDGQGSIKVHLVFKQGDKNFEQSFVFSRTKE